MRTFCNRRTRQNEGNVNFEMTAGRYGWYSIRRGIIYLNTSSRRRPNTSHRVMWQESGGQAEVGA
jgi:hypothetical protein